MTFVESSVDRFGPPQISSTSRSFLKQAFTDCRRMTLDMVQDCNRVTLYTQAHPDFSPIGWHLGHIAFTESLWILEQLASQPCPFPQYRRLFAADGLPKAEREKLPELAEIFDFLSTVRQHVWDYLAIAPLEPAQLRLWHWLLQHESQHGETMAMVMAMHGVGDQGLGRDAIQNPVDTLRERIPTDRNSDIMIQIPAGEFEMGYGGIDAIDNERPVQRVTVDAFQIDRALVTQTAYRQFIAAGGYDNAQWWTPEGWAWCQQAQVRQPLYWRDEPADDARPVCGVSWYEADAYARFMGKRLPTEAEWEKAAKWAIAQGDETDFLGDRWQWTNAWFEPYPNFQPYPYKGYSRVYFDQAHRVMRGGSWVTRPWSLRATFRNWYHPHMQQMFTGIRCAQSI
ncbi:MAG: SUMF1/EgtB/PvdO family nonheme iron enzyme [Cyanobacteria bacterium P01_A01_bin.123]